MYLTRIQQNIGGLGDWARFLHGSLQKARTFGVWIPDMTSCNQKMCILGAGSLVWVIVVVLIRVVFLVLGFTLRQHIVIGFKALGIRETLL